MSYTRLRYHITFATKDRRPSITERLEPLIHKKLREACESQGGHLFEIGGIPDHVHLLADVPGTCAVSEFVKELKRQSTLAIQSECDQLSDFRWQKRYGAFTLGDWDLPPVGHYVRNQKKRHSEGDVWKDFEPD